MSAKKKEKNEWIECQNCRYFIPRFYITKHQNYCNSEQNVSKEDSANSASIMIEHGCVKDSVFRGILRTSEVSNATVPDSRQDLVQIHPTTLKICNFPVASIVDLKYKGKNTYCTLWPNSSVPIDAIVVSSIKSKFLTAAKNDLIKVVKPSIAIVTAKEIVFDALDEKGETYFEILKDELLYVLDGSVLQTSEYVSCSYYGTEYVYQVRKIDGEFDNHLFVMNKVTERTSNLKLDSGEISEGATPQIDQMIFCASFLETRISIKKKYVKDTENLIKIEEGLKNMIHQIGGLQSQKKLLDDLVVLPFKYPNLYQECCVTTPKGIILFGQSGTGKTLLAKGVIGLIPNAYHYVINGPELTSKYLGETEEKLRNIFIETKSKAPSILIIDELDSVCPKRVNSTNDTNGRIIATLVKLMDSIPSDLLFTVIGITSDVSAIDLSLRRPGRFEKEIEVTVPNLKERFEIFSIILKNKRHSLSISDFDEIVELTHGYVGADLDAVCKEAGIIAMRNLLREANIEDVETNVFTVTVDDIKTALLKIGPSALKAVTVDIPKVYWKDIGGQSRVKQKLKEAIEWPLKHPDVFKRMGIRPPKGLLMYGPPGCSKTLMAKALATESGLNFISIKGPELFNKYLGESEKAIREIFQKAKVAAPSIIFFDEIDAIGVKRSGETGGNNAADRVLAQLLTELDGVEGLEGVIVVAATNRPDIIDSALLRPGRIDRLIYVPLPDEETRKEIFEIQFRTMPVSKDVNIVNLVQISRGYSGAEICSLCRESAIIALRENFSCAELTQKNFEKVFHQIKPAISQDMITFYDEFVNKTTEKF